jgi:hypothetical protein
VAKIIFIELRILVPSPILNLNFNTQSWHEIGVAKFISLAETAAQFMARLLLKVQK